ncbi:hypothetical protein DFH09DRAFT_1270675 [Mycena vulgaris]|nr:hypothetical protein DFH09DRAFT_1270675 [Mycena vulgaris]
MWSAISLDLDRVSRYPQQLHVLKDWLERFKTCPLSVALDCGDCYIYDPEINTTAKFLEALGPHCVRWADMIFLLPGEDLNLIHGDMSRLRKVIVGPPSDYNADTPGLVPVVAFDRAPNLTNVALSNCFNPFAIVLPWSQLTTLDGYLYYREIAEILRHTMRLERCQIMVATSELLMGRTTIPPLSHLSYLSLQSDGDSCESAIRLLDALVLPALRVLQFDQRVLDDKPENGVALSTFVSFVSRMQSLEELRITDSRRPEGFYHGIFPDSTFQIDANYAAMMPGNDF